MNIPRKRSNSNSNKKSKEKYEILFKNEENEDFRVNEQLLKDVINSVNSIVLESFEQEISKVNFEQSLIVKKNFELLLKECIKQIDPEGKKVNVYLMIRSLSLPLFFRRSKFKENWKLPKNDLHGSVLLHEKIKWHD
jgi:hypothetical protein